MKPEYFLRNLSSIIIEDEDGAGELDYRILKLFKIHGAYNSNIHTKQGFANLVRWTAGMNHTSFVVLSGYSDSGSFVLCYGLLREYSSKPSAAEKNKLNRDFENLKQSFNNVYIKLTTSDLTKDDAWFINSLQDYSNVLTVRGIPQRDERLEDPLQRTLPNPLNPSGQKSAISNDTLGRFLELVTFISLDKGKSPPFLMYTVIDKEHKKDIVNFSLTPSNDREHLIKKEYEHRYNLSGFHDEYLSHRTFVLTPDNKSAKEVEQAFQNSSNLASPFDIQIENIPQADLSYVELYVKSMKKPLKKESQKEFPQGLENYLYCTFITPEEATGFDLPKKHLPGFSSHPLKEEIEISYFNVKLNERKTIIFEGRDIQDVFINLYNFIGTENIQDIRVKKMRLLN